MSWSFAFEVPNKVLAKAAIAAQPPSTPREALNWTSAAIDRLPDFENSYVRVIASGHYGDPTEAGSWCEEQRMKIEVRLIHFARTCNDRQ